jgi:hypothetical protein
LGDETGFFIRIRFFMSTNKMNLSIIDSFEIIRTTQREKEGEYHGESCCEEEGCCEEAGEEGCQEGHQAPLKQAGTSGPSFETRLGTV